MSIEYYDGIDGVTINLENLSDVEEAIDILHTQAVDAALGQEVIVILEQAMD